RLVKCWRRDCWWSPARELPGHHKYNNRCRYDHRHDHYGFGRISFWTLMRLAIVGTHTMKTWFALRLSKLRSSLACALLAILCGFTIAQLLAPGSAAQTEKARERESSIGRELSVPTHLRDGEEFTIPLEKLLAHGKLLFSANWTEQEGGGRPLTKGTGRTLSDPSRPLTGSRAFNRISAPDANSCAGCHNSPYGIPGG